MDSHIPSNCSSEQLYKEADEVVQLVTNLATLEDQFETLYFRLYQEVPSPFGHSEESARMFVLNKIKSEHSDLWTSVDTTRARIKGLTLKSQIINAATRTAAIESGVGLHV